MNNINRLTTISLSRENYNRLKKYGCAGETFDQVITRVLNNLQLDAIAMDQVRGNETK